MTACLIPRQNLDFMFSWLEPGLQGEELATTRAVLDVAEELAADAFSSHYIGSAEFMDLMNGVDSSHPNG
jgi:hypothetical protein